MYVLISGTKINHLTAWVLLNYSYRWLSGGVQAETKKAIEDNAEILLADVPVILQVAYSAKKLCWAASTWAGKNKKKM